MKLRACAVRRALFAVLCAGLILADNASATDASELWPELSAFVTLTPATRLYLDASFVRGEEFRSLDLSAFVDISLAVIKWPNFLS
jgi:hypothetical protein